MTFYNKCKQKLSFYYQILSLNSKNVSTHLWMWDWATQCLDNHGYHGYIEKMGRAIKEEQNLRLDIFYL